MNPSHTITDTLVSKEEFISVLEYFIQNSIREQFEESDDYGPLSYSSFYERFLPQIAMRSVDCIYRYGQSPIEKIFLSSLLLLAVKNRMAFLHITPPLTDIEADIKAIREKHMLIMQIIEKYKQVTGDEELEHFDAALKKKVAAGDFTEEEAVDIQVHRVIVENFEWNSYHLTLQAGLPHIKVDGKSIRCDILVWVPGDETVKIVIECDGFAYHNSKDSFTNDRARDRALQLNGYRIIRFSGAEINKNPAKISSEVFDLLQAMDNDLNENRIL